jgi:TCP-1/cpn60 chaperonin family
MIDEAERSLHDALSVLSQTVKETRVSLGGGCAEMLMSCAVDEEAKKIVGKKALAVEAFSHALRQIPTILADNAGYDSSDLVSRLRAAHYEGRTDAGLGMLLIFPAYIQQLSYSCDIQRYGPRINWFYARLGHYRKLQAEEAGNSERQ